MVKGIAVFGLVFLTSCATLLSGLNKDIYVDTTPDVSNVFVNGEECGTSRSKVPVRRTSKECVITVKKDGYRSESVELHKKFNKVAWLNLIGGVGFLVDWASGAIVTYDETSVVFDMQPLFSNPQTEVAGRKIKTDHQ